MPRLGNLIWRYPPLKGYYSYEDNDNNGHIKEGKVTIRIYTHGIRISSGFFKTFDLHYSQIDSMKYKSPGMISSILKSGVKGVIGGILTGGDCFLNGANGAADGAISSQSAIRIQYRNPDTGSKEDALIYTKTKEKTNAFIDRYNKEIEITKRTGRSSNIFKCMLIAAGKFILFFGVVIAVCLILIIGALTDTTSSSRTADGIAENEIEVTTPPTTEPSTEPQQNEKGWNAIGDTKCKQSASSGTLTLIKDKNVLEIQSPTIYDGLNDISIIFDHNEPIQAKCTSVDSSKVRIAADHSLIKKMRNGTNMKIIVPGNDSAESKTLKFSLMGFSKACEWAK